MTRVFLDFLHDNRDIDLMAGHDGYTRYTLRIPDALYERVKNAAGEKSVNAEIVATLEEMYPEPFAKDEDLLLACSAALMYSPERSGGQFAAQHSATLSYIAQVHGVDDPLKKVEALQRDTSVIKDIPMERLLNWMSLRLNPWITENLPAKLDAHYPPRPAVSELMKAMNEIASSLTITDPTPEEADAAAKIIRNLREIEAELEAKASEPTEPSSPSKRPRRIIKTRKKKSPD